MQDTSKNIVMEIKFFLVINLCFLAFILQGCGDVKKHKDSEEYVPYFSSRPTSAQINLEYTYISFGEYPQTRISEKDVDDGIVNTAYDENGYGVCDGKKIYRSTHEKEYRYYLVEDIMWRVIDCDDEKAVLWCDSIIDSRAYIENKEEKMSDEKFSKEENDTVSNTSFVTWSGSDLRRWLNENFLYQAFDEDEIKDILNVKYDNYNSIYGYPMGEEKRKKCYIDSTDDKVTLRDGYDLTLICSVCPYKVKGQKEETNVYIPDMSQYYICNTTDYALDMYKKKLDKWYYKKYVPGYWVRTPIIDTDYIECVTIYDTFSDFMDLEFEINFKNAALGIRPMIVIDRRALEKNITHK